MLISEGFIQKPYQLPPVYSSDNVLASLLRRTLSPATFTSVESDLLRFEETLEKSYRKWALLADDLEPAVLQYDQWGRRVDELKTSEGWRRLKEAGAAEGLVAIPLERKEGAASRTIGFAKTYLFTPDSRYVGCPLSMTDGCARVLQEYGTPEMKEKVLPRLISRDPAKAWTSGQWMTERPGGSDVSLTETVAKPLDALKSGNPGDAYALDGFKWFSSATDGDVSLALARTGPSNSGARGLSLFLVELRPPGSKHPTNGIEIHRLKKKYGTKQVPTAELSLSGTVGHLIGKEGEGVRTISTVLNVTRLYSAISSIASLKRGLSIAKAFAAVRHVGGEKGTLLIDNPLHTSALVKAEVSHRALFHLVFGTIGLMGRSEALPEREIGEEEKWRLRLLTPVVKSFTAEIAVGEMPALMESLGGQGYMQENEFGRLIADMSVEKIWEGTTNVLALDVVRVILKSKGAAIKALIDWGHSILLSVPSRLDLEATSAVLGVQLKKIQVAVHSYLVPGKTPDPRLPRPLLFLIGFLTSSLYLLDHIVWESRSKGEEWESDRDALRIWVAQGGLVKAGQDTDFLVQATLSEKNEAMQKEAKLVYGKSKL